MYTRNLEQDGFDIMYQAEIKQYLERVQALEENMNRAYSLLIGTYCSKAIQGRVEKHPQYETKIRDDPIELLRAVSMLIHNPVRSLPLHITKLCHYENVKFKATRWRVLDRLSQEIQTIT